MFEVLIASLVAHVVVTFISYCFCYFCYNYFCCPFFVIAVLITVLNISSVPKYQSDLIWCDLIWFDYFWSVFSKPSYINHKNLWTSRLWKSIKKQSKKNFSAGIYSLFKHVSKFTERCFFNFILALLELQFDKHLDVIMISTFCNKNRTDAI